MTERLYTPSRPYPRWSVIVGYLAAVCNLGLAVYQWHREAWGFVLLNLLAAAVVSYTTTGLVRSWRQLEEARRRYQEALLRQAESDRN